MNAPAEPIVPTRTLLGAYAALMVLLVVTWALSFVHLGDWSVAIALTIGGIKALVVILVFMEVRDRETMTKIVAAAGFYWLSIMLILTMSDYVTRAARHYF